MRGIYGIVRIDLEKTNGLSKISAVDALQVRGVATERFIRKLGHVSSTTMDEIVAVIAAVIEYEWSTLACSSDYLDYYFFVSGDI